jgi:Tol biopolymer transport system component
MQLSLARKSGAFVYSTLRHDRNIWRLDLQQKTWSRLVASSSQDASPQLSPTGGRLCFRSDRTGEDQLWLSNADGSEQTQFTHGQLFPSVGRWAPDGSAIVFNNSSTGGIFLAPLEGPPRGLTAAGYHPVFSPDGKWIYAGSMTAILRFPAQGGEPVEIARTRAMSLGVSHDGAYVYFVREPNDSTLWRASTATGGISRMLEGLVPGCTSCWASGEAGIYYLGNSSQSLDSQSLYFLPYGADKPRLVLDYPEPLYPLGSGPFSLSPDERYLVTVRVDASNSDVMRVESFVLP